MVDMNVNINGADGPKKKNNSKVSSYLTGDNSAQQSGSIFNNSNNQKSGGFSVVDELDKNIIYEGKKIKAEPQTKSTSNKKTDNKPMQQIEDSYKMPEKKDYSVLGGMKAQDKKLANASSNPAFEMSKAEKSEAQKLNKSESKRIAYQNEQQARQDAIKEWKRYIDYYKIDVTGMSADEIKQAALDAKESKHAQYRKSLPSDPFTDYQQKVDEFNEIFDDVDIDRAIENSFDDSINSGSKFRKTTVFGGKPGYEGNIGGQNFKLYRRKNEMQLGNQYLGKIGNKQVNVEERERPISGAGSYAGSIGKNGISISSKPSPISNFKVVYSGSYKGKNFSVSLNKNMNAVDGKIMTGSYGDQQVQINSERNVGGNSKSVQGDKIPKDFADVVALLFVINSEN